MLLLLLTLHRVLLINATLIVSKRFDSRKEYAALLLADKLELSLLCFMMKSVVLL